MPGPSANTRSIMEHGAPLSCQHCGTLNDPRPSTTGVSACASCGLTAIEGAFSMQDELSKLFDRGLAFSPPQQEQSPPIATERPALGYSASQHYIPVTRPVIQIDEITMPLELQSLLLRHKIDPVTLAPAQRNLFENASQDQRERLIMLWSISSPADTRKAAAGQSETTSMWNEEAHARMAYEKRHQVQQVDSAEPYISLGYSLEDPLPTYKQATDPAFDSKEWWRHETPQQPPEFQYGMFEAMREYHVPIADDEMMF